MALVLNWLALVIILSRGTKEVLLGSMKVEKVKFIAMIQDVKFSIFGVSVCLKSKF